MLLHILSSAMGWMDLGPLRSRQQEANDKNYPTKANNYASIHGAAQSRECIICIHAMLIIGHGLRNCNLPDNNRPWLGFAVIY